MTANPNLMEYVAKASERFWSKVDIRSEDECWNWKGYTNKYGYGTITIKGRPMRCNRVAYMLSKGEDPGLLDVLHTCDNRPCCNPNHFFLGTITDNHKDMVAKHRNARRDHHNKTKLTWEDVRGDQREVHRQIREPYWIGKRIQRV